MASLTHKRKALAALKTITQKLANWHFDYTDLDWFQHVSNAEETIGTQIRELQTSIHNHETRRSLRVQGIDSNIRI